MTGPAPFPLVAAARRGTLLFLLFAVLAAIMATVFRVVVPDLIDAHDDTLALLGLLAAVGGFLAAAWLAVAIVVIALHPLRETKDPT